MDLSLHTGQLKIYHNQRRYRTVVAGRRFGKSRLGINELALAALGFEGEVDPLSTQTVMGIMPTLVMARSILWRPLLAMFTQTELKRTVKSINKSELQIDLRGKPPIRIRGADKGGDGIRGTRIYFALVDEVQDVSRSAIDEVLIPAMADTDGSRALFTGTPKGRLNIHYELYKRAETDPLQYASFNMPTDSNPLIPRSFLEQQKLILPPRVYEQEFRASFVNFPGQIYTELSSSNLVKTAPGDYELVLMGIDWGDLHPAFTVAGLKNGVWYLLEVWSPDTGQAIPQTVQDTHLIRLAKKYGVDRSYCDPSRPSAILGVRALGNQHSLPGLSKATEGYNRIAEGLSQVHSLIHQNKFVILDREPDSRVIGDMSGKDIYQQFEAYHYARDRDQRVLVDKVEDGQPDHVLDSVRYLISTKVKSKY